MNNTAQATRGSLAPALVPVFELFLYGAVIVLIAALVSVFLRDVPLRSRSAREEAEIGTPVASFGD
jgi:hypothetical protein